jgi:hypothetical protein
LKFQQLHSHLLILIHLPSLDSLLYYRAYPPSFPLAQGPAFFNHYPIADITDIAWIISHITGPSKDEFAIELMANTSLNLDNYTLVHFVADYGTDSCLSCYFCITHLSFSICFALNWA